MDVLKVEQGTPDGVSNFEFEKLILPEVGIYLLLLKFSLVEHASLVDPVKPPIESVFEVPEWQTDLISWILSVGT